MNYELGTRFRIGSLESEVVGFFNDYANLLGRDTLSSGGQGTGDLFNGGSAEVRGLEVSLQDDLRESLALSVALPVRVAYTLSEGHFRNSFTSSYEPWGDVENGDSLPGLPRHQLYLSAGLGRNRWTVDFESVFTSRTRVKAGQGPVPIEESTDPYLVLNVTGQYRLKEEGTSLFISVENLFDRHSIVARRPAGVRPGLGRTFTTGVRFALDR